MNNENNNQPIREKVLEIIKNGKVTMKPKWHFIFRTSLAVIGGMIIILVLLYLISFVIFILHQTGVWFMPVFGSEGWHELFNSLPWILVILSITFIIVLEILVRHYSFGYGQPLFYSAIGIIAIVIAGGIIIACTPLHNRLFKYAEENKLPFAGGFYRGFGLQHLDNVQLGTIIEITSDGFIIWNRQNEKLNVVISRKTRFPLGMDFERGDAIVIFGKRDDHTVQATGIREVERVFGPGMPVPAQMPMRFPFPFENF